MHSAKDGIKSNRDFLKYLGNTSVFYFIKLLLYMECFTPSFPYLIYHGYNCNFKKLVLLAFFSGFLRKKIKLEMVRTIGKDDYSNLTSQID